MLLLRLTFALWYHFLQCYVVTIFLRGYLDIANFECLSFNCTESLKSRNWISILMELIFSSSSWLITEPAWTISRGRNKPKLPLVRRISDMLQTTCPPTCPLVQVLFHFVGPNWMLSTIKIADNLREDMGLTALLLFLVWSVWIGYSAHK